MVDFLKYRFIYFLISALVIGVGIFSVLRWGYRFSIDFVGGTNLEYRTKNKVTASKLDETIRKNNIESIEYKLDNNRLTLRAKAMTEKQETGFKNELEAATGGGLTVLKSETVGPILGRESMIKTGIASVLAIVGILLYMSFAFKGFRFAVSAIMAMFHDFLVVMGSYSIMSHFFKAEVDTMFVTAVLTTMSFSVHDTIVIFDKIREYMQTGEKGNIEYYANRALTETMVRSINNSMTIIFMLLALALLGGDSIRFFVITLLIGTVTGTYSSPFIATPILVFMEKNKQK